MVDLSLGMPTPGRTHTAWSQKLWVLNKLPVIDCFISSQVENTSPVQWPAKWPKPAKLDLEITNGLEFLTTDNALKFKVYIFFSLLWNKKFLLYNVIDCESYNWVVIASENP